MSIPDLPGGAFRLAEDLTLTRVGYGAMQLAGPHVFGPPADRAEAVAVLRTAVELGITHIDTSDYYGPYVTNEIIREALHPYPKRSADRHQGGGAARREGRMAHRAGARAAAASRPRQP